MLAACAALVACGARPASPGAAAASCVPAAGDQRLVDALLHVPKGADGRLPLVLAFHDEGGTGPGFAAYTGLSEFADDHGFAVLYPSAAKRHFWSLNRSMGTEDVERLRALLPQALAAACGDPRRIFATGVSNGGGFAARVGCELEQIRAIAPVSGGYRALDRCPASRRVSVLEIHGTADTVVPYDGRPPDRRGAVPPNEAVWRFFAAVS